MSRYKLAGRTVAITGATGGFGRALATELRRRGANLALLDLDQNTVHELARELGGDTVARGWVADVRDLGSLQAAMDGAANHFGRLDVVVANAGIDVIDSLTFGNPANFEKVIDINLTGVWRTFRAGAPHVVANRGHLLAVSSMAAFIHSPLQSAYTASKAGVWAMCDSIRLELRHTGVTVGSLHPTFFHTPLIDDVLADPAGRELWGEFARAPWKPVPLDRVVTDAVHAIERRATLVTSPRSLGVVARAPGFARDLINRIGFRHTSVRRAIELSQSTGQPTTNRSTDA